MQNKEIRKVKESMLSVHTKSERNNVMGMAASQARFLGLTARKTNTEYEGQQINQQRTALSNKSAAYYNDLLTMSVPVAPAATDYTTTVYSFSDGSLTNQLTQMIARPNGQYTVSYLRTYTDDNAIVSTTPSIVTRVPGTTPQTPSTWEFKIGGEYLRKLDEWTGIEFKVGTQALDLRNGVYYYTGTSTAYTGDISAINVTVDPAYYPLNGYYNQLNAEQFKGLSVEEKFYLDRLREGGYGGTTDDWEVRYVLNTTTGISAPEFYNRKVLENAVYNDETQRSVSSIGAYTRGSANVTDEIKNVDAFLEQDATGRYTNITIIGADGSRLTYSLSTNTITDSDAYLDAMNQYEYDKAQYDKRIQEVNAKIEIVQAEDKNLELRLKQLDTEQKAIQTEIDAVSSVIKNNVEKSFKTFNA